MQSLGGGTDAGESARLVALRRPAAPYSLADRDVERELLPMARALGLAFTRRGMLERIEAGGAPPGREEQAFGIALEGGIRMIEARPEWLEWAAQEVSASG